MSIIFFSNFVIDEIAQQPNRSSSSQGREKIFSKKEEKKKKKFWMRAISPPDEDEELKRSLSRQISALKIAPRAPFNCQIRTVEMV